MCMEDVWIARHTKYTPLGLVGATLAVPGNPRRVAVILAGHVNCAVRTEKGELIADIRDDGFPYIPGWTTTTQIPPGVDTTVAGSVAYYSAWKPTVLHVRDWGVLIQGGLILSSTSGGMYAYTIDGDEKFEEAYNRFDKGRQ